MPSVRIVVCVFLASCFFNDVASYNPYAYNPSYFPAAYDNSQLSMGDIDWSKRRDYDYNFGMSDGDWGMGYGSKNKAEYVKAPKEIRSYNFGMGDGDWGMGWGSKINSEYVRKVKRSLNDERNYNFGMSDGDWGMGWGSKDNSEYVKVKKSQIPKIKKSDKRRDYDFGFGMGDADWGMGWGSKDKTEYILKVQRKSLEDEDEDESNPLEDEIATSLELKRSPYTYKSYKYRQPYMLPRRPSRTAISRTAYAPYRAYARYGAIPRPQGRQYAYASMADADWGWKKRSQLPALMGTNTEDAEEEVLANALDKRNLASLAKNNFFPREYKRSQDTDSDDSDVLEEEKRHVSSLNRSGRSAFEEEKRHVSSLNRSGRSASSLARSGELRGRK